MPSVEVLSRMQFALSLTFHYIYPPLSIGLSLALIYMEAQFLRTGKKIWEKITLFWVRVFALTFALGVATGVPLQFTLGTNWGRYSRYVGDVFGSLLAAEGVFAFLIEGGFLGLLLFGWNRISRPMHFLSTVLVSLAAHFSAFWIIIANAWMQTPAGFVEEIAPDGVKVAKVTNWFEMVFNPSAMDHVVHAIFACWISGALLIVSVAAYYLLKKRHQEFSLKSLKIGAYLAFFAALLQLASGHSLGKNTATHNPIKIAAFEGIYKTEEYTPIAVFGYVDTQQEKVQGLVIPGGLSYLIHGNFTTAVKGLDQFKKDLWPNVPVVFQLYHIMIAMWGLIVLAAILAIWIGRKKEIHQYKLSLYFLIISVAFPQIGNISGWYATCMGRQPWIVHDKLKTSEGFSQTISASQNLFSLILYTSIYVLFFVLFLFLLDRKIKSGPSTDAENLPYRDTFEHEELK
jgi:cytochrome bd ubiquinol oxidase subunit I